MNIEMMDITKVKLNPKNPRTIRDEKFRKLVASIQEFPEMLKIRPIIVDEDLTALGGNMRLKACKSAGLTEVPIIRANDLTDEQKKQFIVKDNVNYGDWDYLMLENSDSLVKWGMDMPEWSLEEEDDDEFFREIQEEYSQEQEQKEEVEEGPRTIDGTYLILMLDQEDFNFLKKMEDKINKNTNTENISDAFLAMLKKG